MQFDIATHWYQRHLTWLTFLLLPFSWLFRLIVSLRRFAYQRGLLKSHRLSVPVIVVGNLTVGGTGKTPCVIWLAQFLRSHGWQPGIVSRGVGGQRQVSPHWVEQSDSATVVGDEALLLLRKTHCPMVIGIDRVAAARELLKRANCNIIISDDGLQHYRLARDIEIVMMDGDRRYGNQQLLPAGPLREPLSRLQNVTYQVVTNGNASDQYTLSLSPLDFVSVMDPSQTYTLNSFPYQSVHAVAGIGHPSRFFNQLTTLGFKITTHRFPDHHAYQRDELVFTDDRSIIMTEKDAVKCRTFADARYWYLRVTAHLSDAFEKDLLQTLSNLGANHDVESDFKKYTCRDVRCE
jgi:tetraacyldisaccharide 4'-kinase